ncbi:hypothetical protein GN109_05840 [Collimonas pratensis]|uniref:hypothetical protein n=1 Tax=Collimonas pratensis TaxID=279113 RepID=UPI00143D4B54|nr:hypothetical protein [Collimonas pratensis]NKI68935.1 hypothetical protein [Collimonas pratensis]
MTTELNLKDEQTAFCAAMRESFSGAIFPSDDADILAGYASRYTGWLMAKRAALAESETPMVFDAEDHMIELDGILNGFRVSGYDHSVARIHGLLDLILSAKLVSRAQSAALDSDDAAWLQKADAARADGFVGDERAVTESAATSTTAHINEWFGEWFGAYAHDHEQSFTAERIKAAAHALLVEARP